MIKVTYIQHSSYLVELDHTLLLFDYFPPDALSDRMVFGGKIPAFPQDKKLYVFASHRHRDHWTPEVLAWQKTRHPDISYILSDDIHIPRDLLTRLGHRGDREFKKRIHRVSPVSVYRIDDLVIQTLRSTDEGVAFYIEAEGLHIYHAGDLHWWNWGERGELYCETIGRAYKHEINRLAGKHIDLAFVVLDPRMKEGFSYGMDYFLEHIDCDLVFPCHLWRDYDLIERYKRLPQAANFKDKIVDLTQENMIFEIEE